MTCPDWRALVAAREAEPAADVQDPGHRLEPDQIQPLEHSPLHFSQQEVGTLRRLATLVERVTYGRAF